MPKDVTFSTRFRITSSHNNQSPPDSPSTPPNGFKDPGVIELKLGDLELRVHKTIVIGLEGTCVAMENIAKSELADDANRENGTDDYSSSFERLMNAFDSFLEELGKNRMKPRRALSAGKWEIYDFRDRCDITILLCWQIRNRITHHGGLFNEECVSYERAYARALTEGTKPILDLPPTLPAGLALDIDWAKYRKVKDCIFEYIGRKVTAEELGILRTRSVVGKARIEDAFLCVEVDGCRIILSIRDLNRVGKPPKLLEDGFVLPGGCRAYIDRKQVIFLDDGIAVPARFEKVSP